MNILYFRASEVRCEHRPSEFSTDIDDLVRVLKGLEFTASGTNKNRGQLSSHFDGALQNAIATIPGWEVESERTWPKLHKDVGWDAKPDIVVRSRKKNRIIIEVEKGNKYKVYDDLMKLRLFSDEQPASCGVLICPMNHPNRQADRNPYEYALRALRLLKTAARVPESFFGCVALVGFTQLIQEADQFVHWNWQSRKRLDPGNGE